MKVRIGPFCTVACALFALSFLWANETNAQEGRLALSDPRAFREAFTASGIVGSRSNRSVETLVGVRIGSSAEQFDINTIRIVAGGTQSGGQLCVRMIARDGRYSASAVYNLQPVVKAPAIDAPTRYATELRNYAASDISVSAFIAPNCDIGRSSEVFATLIGKTDNTKFLYVQINAPASRVRAQLLFGDKAVSESVVCLPHEGGPRVGFTGECKIAIGAPVPGLYKLNISETSSSGAGQLRSFPIRLSAEL